MKNIIICNEIFNFNGNLFLISTLLVSNRSGEIHIAGAGFKNKVAIFSNVLLF